MFSHGEGVDTLPALRVCTPSDDRKQSHVEEQRFDPPPPSYCLVSSTPFVLFCRHPFPPTKKPDELYLNLVLEFVPETVYSVARQYHKSKQTLPVLLMKLYLYQLARALAHIHALGICHRDIKPQNLLLDPQVHIVLSWLLWL